uniref:Deleted in lung and esophageal cancer protein 1 n=1 Tax=Dicentrarchus labrax TaxID=13489 RepID=E6ZIV9_DICLA|nr:Deleted in lung and esophageal cancer protein 1 [Dicentrarchus labrax]
MLESHIIEARARAAATEIKSAFSWCVDKDLLETSNLISPQDYLATQKPRVEAPAAIKSNPAKPTIAYTMHMTREPQDDGYTLIARPEKSVPEMNGSDVSLTFESSSDTPKRKKTPREKPNQTKPRPKWKGEPSAKDRAEGWEKLQKLKDRHSFLRNPRFLPPNAQQGGTSLIRPRTKVGKGMEQQSSADDPVPVFLAKPSVVVFTDYIVGHVYETTLELKNLTSASRHVRVIPPTTPYFPIGLGRFPSEGGVVAPGMSCKYTVRFAPDSLGDYEDFIVVETQAEHLFVVVFFPTTAEKSCQVFTVVCDNCQVKDISIEGEGQLIALELVSVSGKKEPPVVGEAHDLTAEHFVRFSPCNPHSVQQKKLIIRNNVHLELPFHWQIMKPNLRPLLPGEIPEPSHIQFHLATDDVFHVSPVTGFLAPCQEEEFLFTFCPKELKDYHSVCHLVLRDVPQLPPEASDNGVLQPVRTGSKVSDVIVMEIEVKGSAEPYQVLLEPYAVVIPGEIFICATTRRQFKMWNHSKSYIFFQWERIRSCHIIEVEPSTGRIEENECFDFDLIVTGGKPERVVTSLVCHIEHHHEPITLAMEVSFKILVEPCRGVLPPLASCSVDVLFMPRFCQQYETELELTVENGTGCHLSVRADVQSPQVCLLNCELLLSELYIGVPAKATITLFNQTLLPSHFSWMAQLEGKHAELCAASFDPTSGTLGPNTSMEITVTFISHTDMELTEVVALCEVQGMNSPLALSIVAPKTKKLSVSYSLPSARYNTNMSDIVHWLTDISIKTVSKFFTRVGDLDPALIPMQMTVKGCPLYFQMTGPRPDDQNQGPIIQFGTHVSGGDTVSRSLRINNPTMFDIRMDWETYNVDPNDRKLVDVVVAYGDAFPVKDADGNEVLSGALRISDGSIQTVWERNETPGSEGTSGSLQSMTGGGREECISEENCEKEEMCLYPAPAKKKLISVHIRPHVGNPSDYPYCITPQQIVIPAKSSGTIHVSFTPLTLSGSVCESRCVGLALGFMSLDSEMAACVPGKVGRAQALDLEPVRMDLLAVVKPAVLLVQMEEDEGVLEFCASAGDLLKGESEKEVVVHEFDITRTFRLKNNSEMLLHFRLGAQPPFSVLKPQPRARTSNSSNPPTGDSHSLMLQPQSSLQVKVAFHCSLSLLDHADQVDELEVPLGVTLVHTASGHMKLRFQQNLLIHYSNNSLQTVPLRAHLDLAILRLSTDSINFGFCYVGQTQTIEINLYSHGAHTYWKSIIDGDSCVFRVTPDFGCLSSKEVHVTSCSQCLQISFSPSEDREFRAVVVIRSPLVKIPLTLQLQGTGSFDEVYRCN